MSTCAKDFTLVVASGVTCPDWSLIVWDTVSFIGFDASGSAVGDTAQFTLNGGPDVGMSSFANIHGTLVFTGGPCSCLFSTTGSWGPPIHPGGFGISIEQDAATALSDGSFPTIGTIAQPSASTPFNLIAGVGSVIDITITGLGPSGNIGMGIVEGNITLTMTFSCI